jgi:uncharacterized membrane protein
MMIGMLVFWLLIPAIIVWLLLDRRQVQSSSADHALRILEERFARGEIDAEELRTRRMAVEDAAK